MIPDKRTRGRPKGTGLNDFAQLQAIATHRQQMPEWTVTTAIRKGLGIENPSVVRRLRDKYQAWEAEMTGEMRATAQETLANLRSPETPVTAHITVPRATVRAAALTADPSERISQPLASLQRRSGDGDEPAAPQKAEDKPKAAIKAPAVEKKAEVFGEPAPKRQRPPRLVELPSETKLPEWLGVGISVYSISMEAHFAVVGTLFEWPPLAAVLRTQVAFAEVVAAAVSSSNRFLEAAATIRT